MRQVARFLASIEHEKRDISMDDEAKALWKRKNGGSTELPMILVDNERAWARLDCAHRAAVGTIEQLEEAVEFRELQQFLRLDRPPPTADADDSLLADLVRLDSTLSR